MILLIHRFTAFLSLLCILVFMISTLMIEFTGDASLIEGLKRLIVMPGLLILVPAIAATGASGFYLSRGHSAKLLQTKKRRMPLIAANGILLLVPCALVLNHWATQGALDGAFYTVQVVELIAGAVNLLLIGRNMRDGLLMTGRIKPRNPAD